VDAARRADALAALCALLFELDGDAALRALWEVARRGVAMPGTRMEDGWHGAGNHLGASGAGGGGRGGGGDDGGKRGEGKKGAEEAAAGEGGASEGDGGGSGATPLFRDWSAAADALGVLTVADYAAALEQLMQLWNVSGWRLALVWLGAALVRRLCLGAF